MLLDALYTIGGTDASNSSYSSEFSECFTSGRYSEEGGVPRRSKSVYLILKQKTSDVESIGSINPEYNGIPFFAGKSIKKKINMVNSAHLLSAADVLSTEKFPWMTKSEELTDRPFHTEVVFGENKWPLEAPVGPNLRRIALEIKEIEDMRKRKWDSQLSPESDDVISPMQAEETEGGEASNRTIMIMLLANEYAATRGGFLPEYFCATS